MGILQAANLRAEFAIEHTQEKSQLRARKSNSSFTKGSQLATIIIKERFRMYKIEIYQTSTGKEPYTEWEGTLDKSTFARIDARIARIRESGNFGICEPVGEGVFELKFDFGPGYRVYFGYDSDIVLLLLCGGNKKGQQRDIDKAIEYWREHLSLKRGKDEKIQKLQRTSNRKT